MSTKQLYEKTSEGMKEVSPLVSIEDIYSKLSDTPLEALVSLFNHVKCEWKGSVSDTRRTVPLFLRRSGLFITYNNGTKYITEFFSAGTDQITTEGWVKDSNWTSVPDEDYISAGVKPGVGIIGYEQLNDNLKQLFREKVNVTNFPDDEDIASVDNMLKLKDREVDAAKFQSKGYAILRKNLRLVNGVVKNILTQDMINQDNTIYEIRYDFDANGETINIPENCTLKFKGGSLNNGSINLNYCHIINGKIHLIPLSLPSNGIFKISDFNVNEKSEPEYNSTIVQAMLDINARKEIYFDSKGTIEFDKELNWSNTNLRGLGRDSSKQVLNFPKSNGFVARETITQISIKDLSISSRLNGFQIDSGYIIYFDNVEAISKEGSCFVGNIGAKVFEVTFNNIRVNALTGKYCFDHFCGNTMVFSNINALNAGISIFNYCCGYIYGCNGCWERTPHFVTTSSDNFNDTLEYTSSLVIEQTNIESYKDVLFDLTGESIGSFSLYLGKNVNLYLAPKVNGKYEKPFVKANGLRLYTKFPIKYNETEWKESIYPIMTSIVGNNINNLHCEGNVDVYLTDNNKLISFRNSYVDDSIAKSSYIREKGILLQGINRVVDLDHIYLNRCFIKETKIIYPSNVEKLQLDVTTAQSFIISRNSSEDIKETKEIQLDNNYLTNGINYGELKKQYDFVTITNKANNTSFKIFGFDYFGNQNPTLAPNESCVFANYNGKYICISINQLRNIRSYKTTIPSAPSINGACLYNEGSKKVVYSYNGSWVDALGNNGLAKYNGTTQQRPTEINLGFQYFDTTLNKPIWWTGKKWVDATGADV